MDPSRICLGHDNDYIYVISPYGIHSYDIQQGITSVTRNGALDNTDSFVTCFGYQNHLYVGAVNSAGNTKFMSYRVAVTPQQQQEQPQLGSGSSSFDIILDGHHQLNATNVVSMIPVFLPILGSGDNNNTNNSSSGPIISSDQYHQQQSCLVTASNIPGQFNGLYQMCNHHGHSTLKIPFPDQTSTTPLLATNTDHSSIVLLGYPNAKSVYVYSNLDDLLKPDAVYELDIAIPSRGSVQVLNDAATEFLIFDYSRTITHLQLAPKIMTGNSFTLELNIDQRSSGVIALGNHNLFTVSERNDHGYVFEEIPFGARFSQSTNQLIEDTPALSASSTESPPSLSIVIIGIIIGGSIIFVICLLLLGIWLLRRNRRNRQRRTNSQEDEVRSYLTLKEDPEEQLSPLSDNQPTDDMEHGNGSLASENKTTDNGQHVSSTPRQHYALRHRDTIITNNNDMGNRNTSIRRGIDTIIQRMVSLRSPQSPTSIFSLFSNISNTPPPVADKYRKVKRVHFPPGASELMEPTFFDSNGTLIVNGHYQLLDDPETLTTTMNDDKEEHHRIPGYASRTIQHATKDESIRTLHYYPASQQNAFLRNINITIRLQESPRIIHHHDAISLDTPTRSTQYQHYWISGLCMAQQSLHYLLHDQNDQNHPAIVDTRQFNFMSLTVLSLLSCLRDVHALDCCHLGLSLRSFYYQKVSAITEWYVGRFDQAHVIGQPEGYGLMLDVYSAPELVKETAVMAMDVTATTPCLGQQQQTTTPRHYCYKFSPRPALDCWSLGCVIYEVATGVPLFNDFDQLYQLCSQPSSSQLESHLQQAYDKVDTIHPSFRACLESLLQVNPMERSSVKMALDRWIKANQLDDDLD